MNTALINTVNRQRCIVKLKNRHCQGVVRTVVIFIISRKAGVHIGESERFRLI